MSLGKRHKSESVSARQKRREKFLKNESQSVALSQCTPVAEPKRKTYCNVHGDQHAARTYKLIKLILTNAEKRRQSRKKKDSLAYYENGNGK